MNVSRAVVAATTLAAAGALGQPRPIQTNLELAARRILTEPCRLEIRGASHCSRRQYPRVIGGLMRTWDVRWRSRISQGEPGNPADGDITVIYAPPGVQAVVRTPADFFSGGQVGELPAPASDFSFTADVADSRALLRAYLTDRALPPATPSTAYLNPWTTGELRAGVLIRWYGSQPPRLHLASGRLPLNDPGGELSQRQDLDVTAAFAAGVTGRLEIPIAAGDGLPAVVVSTADGFDETGLRVYYGGTEFSRPAGSFQVDIIAVPGWQTLQHISDSTCTPAALRSWFAAGVRPNTFMHLIGHNEGFSAISPQVFEERTRELLLRDAAAVTSPQVGVPVSELRWVLLAPWQHTGFESGYADALRAVAENPPPGLTVGQVGVISLYDLYGGVNPFGGLHFGTEAEADKVLGDIWEQLRLACPACACQADCNRDGALNLSDFGCFSTKFALADPYADCNDDGVLNLADFGCFQTRFALGCP